MTKSLHLKLPEKLYLEIEEAKDEFGFLNVQEFFKEAARRALYEYRKQRALAVLEARFGSVKQTRRRTKEELDKLAKELSPERANQLLDECGLKRLR